MTHGAGTS